jgi:LuxR family glucitol operon transcriptional activator
MVVQSKDEFARLLSEGVYRIKIQQSKSLQIIQDELGYALGRQGGTAVEHWRRGNIPADLADLENLAREIVKRGRMDQNWLEQFLRHGRHPDPQSLIAELFPHPDAKDPVEKQPFDRPEEPVELQEGHLAQHLPPPDYVQLFGANALLDQLVALLRQDDGPRMISIEGLGGIGKTALATALANRMAGATDLAGIVWLSARHEWLTSQGDIQTTPDPARSLADIVTRLADQLGQTKLAGFSVEDKLAGLRPLLTAHPYLIIIDNLETVDDTALLLPALTPLMGQTRFLLTSRYTLSHYSFAYRLAVPPLSLADSRALIESELRRRGRSIQLDAPTMQQLHDIIGGVPLALKLTAAQLAHLPLSDVITGLQKANRQSSERLFTYIYRRAWQLLDEPAKALLISLLSISPEGEDIAWLRIMGGLPENEFEAALQQLTAYSLLEVAGSPDAPVYRLHRLTTTFLQTEILLNWSS